ncbi:hypothetical protein VKT23_010304 [Stygiomarasmius scandens]|uniref:Cytochrome P450 n=1 Tax=Marasmiellus scandens TaxID=2682957 RepID=A0ABR1JC41_9AGAR
MSDITGLALRAFSGFVVLYLIFRVLSSKQNKSITYPGPPKWPILGNLLDLRSTQPLLKHPGRAFRDWGQQFGSPAVSLQIPGASMLVFNHVKDVQELLVKRSNIYTDREDHTF